MSSEIELTEHYRSTLESAIKKLINEIGEVPIGTKEQLPFGWRKAAKGRTVWRILEEVISQNLEKTFESLGFYSFTPSTSEVGVYDFSFSLDGVIEAFVNVKSAVRGARANKDDISKAVLIDALLTKVPNTTLFVATIEIEFLQKPTRIKLSNCYVVPVAWLPDIYVNPSNNGNLQSAKYKDLPSCVKRTNKEFHELLKVEIERAKAKKHAKLNVKPIE